MNDHFLIPRLAPGEASALFERHVGDLRRGAGPTDLVDLNVRGTPNRTGGAVPRPWVVEGWRKQVIEQIDMPEDMTISERSTFGLRVGRAVEEVISPILADAAHDGTWWYLSLAVFPDLVYRRWPVVGTGADLLLSRDRWLGGLGSGKGKDRNFLKNSWRRWVVFGPVGDRIEPPLGEDEMVQMLERAAVARNIPLIRQCALAIGEYGSEFPSGRMEFARALMRRVSWYTGSTTLDIYPEHELCEFVRGVAADLVAATAKRAR